MKKDEILKKIELNNPDDWRFIDSTLDNRTIDEIAQEWSENSETPPCKSAVDELFEEVGIECEEEEKKEYWEHCLDVLMHKATVKMWKSISKEQIANLFDALRSVKAESVVMRNGVQYETYKLFECWEKISND